MRIVYAHRSTDDHIEEDLIDADGDVDNNVTWADVAAETDASDMEFDAATADNNDWTEDWGFDTTVTIAADYDLCTEKWLHDNGDISCVRAKMNGQRNFMAEDNELTTGTNVDVGADELNLDINFDYRKFYWTLFWKGQIDVANAGAEFENVEIPYVIVDFGYFAEPDPEPYNGGALGNVTLASTALAAGALLLMF